MKGTFTFDKGFFETVTKEQFIELHPDIDPKEAGEIYDQNAGKKEVPAKKEKV